jgi:hypothetical protein
MGNVLLYNLLRLIDAMELHFCCSYLVESSILNLVHCRGGYWVPILFLTFL